MPICVACPRAGPSSPLRSPPSTLLKAIVVSLLQDSNVPRPLQKLVEELTALCWFSETIHIEAEQLQGGPVGVAHWLPAPSQ